MYDNFVILLVFLIASIISFFLTKRIYSKSKNHTNNNEYNKVKEELITLSAKYSEKEEQFNKINENYKNLEEENNDLKRKNTILETQKVELDKTINNRKEDLEEIKKILPNEFKNLANNIFNEKTNLFKKESKDTLSDIISPLNKEIEKFKTHVTNKFTEETKERVLIQNAINELVTATGSSTKEFSRFTDAITKDSKEQGNFGELILEQILIDSGLIEDKNYIIQGKGLKLKNEELNPEKPDVILKIPPDKHIIIDSKVSLTSFVDYNLESDEKLKKIHLKNFINSVKKHILDLSKKNYQDQHKLKSLEWVIMFMPRRNAYELAINSDSTIQLLAEKNNIQLCHEGIITALLKLVLRSWKLYNVDEDALEIVKKADTLHNRLSRFYNEYFLKIGRNLELAMKAFDQGEKEIKSGRKNILDQSEDLKKMSLSDESKLISKK